MPRLRERVVRRAAADALAQERRRVAAEVHDLVMQEIAFAVASARMLLDRPEPAPEAVSVVAAGERALAAARDIVGGLVRRDREPVARAVEASVRRAARRVRLGFDASGVEDGERADVATCDALVHIGREAVANGVKHGGAGAIAVVLEHREEWRLSVRDDGCGFDRVVGDGFGVESMQATAAALGGLLRIDSVPGSGTTVRAVLP